MRSRLLRLNFDEDSRVSLRIDFSGEPIIVNEVLVDSGFTHKTFGLLLPTSAKPTRVPLGVGRVIFHDGTEKPVDTVPNAEIQCVDGTYLSRPIVTPVGFLDGRGPVLGVKVMKHWIVEFDGPGSKTTIDTAP